MAKKMAGKVERRRSPRTELTSEEVVQLELRHRVNLLEISQTGVLLECETQLPVGARAQIRAELAGFPFSAEVLVKRRHLKNGARQTSGVGTQFGSMDDRSRRYLDEFLQRGKA